MSRRQVTGEKAERIESALPSWLSVRDITVIEPRRRWWHRSQRRPIVHVEVSMSGQPEIEYYVDAAGEHRWRIVAGNGEIISESSEGYVDQRDAEHAAALTLQALQAADDDA